MANLSACIVSLDSIRKRDVASVGGKGANLGELRHAGFPTPPGFVITAAAYLRVLEENGVRAALAELHEKSLVDGANAAALGAEARAKIEALELPRWFFDEVAAAYRSFGTDLRVAVRSSATAEDTAAASFAGMNETFTNTRGIDALLANVRKCWRSLYGDRVVSYRSQRHIAEEPAIAVVVQEMIDADRAGVMFSVDPSTGAGDRVVIEGAFGLGEVVVSGQIEPDTYVVDRGTRRVISTRIGHKTHQIVSGAAGDERVELDDEQGSRRVLTDEEIVAVAALGLSVEDHYGEPQDMEWAYRAG
jgi:pyruvate,water dikinase